MCANVLKCPIWRFHMKRALRKALRRIARQAPGARSRTRLEERAWLAGEVAAKREGAHVYLYERGRDCDQFEASTIHELPAHPLAVQQFVDFLRENAEGPILELAILTREEVDAYEPVAIDHAAAAMGF